MARRETRDQDDVDGESTKQPLRQISCRTNSSETRILIQRWTIPSWEKDFCEEVGLFKWNHFLEAKKNSAKYDYKVIHWNDSAAEEAFHVAKFRYYSARLLGRTYAQTVMDPDYFVDEIKWVDDADHLYETPPRQKVIKSQLERDQEEQDYLYYSRLIEQVRLGHSDPEVCFVG